MPLQLDTGGGRAHAVDVPEADLPLDWKPGRHREYETLCGLPAAPLNLPWNPRAWNACKRCLRTARSRGIVPN